MNNTEKFHPLPQPDDIDIRSREDAMGAYLMMFAAIGAGLPLPIINLIAAIIYYFLNRSKNRFVRFHAAQSLYAQFPTSIMNAVAVIWLVRVIFRNWEWTDILTGYLLATVVANILYFTFSIIAAIRARQGRFYYFLFFGKLAYLEAYKVKAERNKPVNQPPA